MEAIEKKGSNTIGIYHLNEKLKTIRSQFNEGMDAYEKLLKLFVEKETLNKKKEEGTNDSEELNDLIDQFCERFKDFNESKSPQPFIQYKLRWIDLIREKTGVKYNLKQFEDKIRYKMDTLREDA